MSARTWLIALGSVHSTNPKLVTVLMSGNVETRLPTNSNVGEAVRKRKGRNIKQQNKFIHFSEALNEYKHILLLVLFIVRPNLQQLQVYQVICSSSKWPFYFMNVSKLLH